MDGGVNYSRSLPAPADCALRKYKACHGRGTIIGSSGPAPCSLRTNSRHFLIISGTFLPPLYCRTGNTFLGSLLWVDYIRLLGLQKAGAGH